MSSDRADAALVQRGLARSRATAAQLIKSGAVTVDGKPVTKPSQLVADDVQLTVAEDQSANQLASRAGDKLRLAIDSLREQGFTVNIADQSCLDIGASTGGFTQVLLDEGARQVIALDVGHGQLVPALRSDPRVIVQEQTNARYLTTDQLPYRPQFITCDVSFISLKLMFPPIHDVAAPEAQVLLLIKPQFEVGKGKLGKGGIVRDPTLIDNAIVEVTDAARGAGIAVATVIPSQVVGAGGNQEFFLFGSVTK